MDEGISHKNLIQAKVAFRDMSYKRAKRAFDILFSIMSLILASPFMLLVCLILLFQRQNVIFSHKRVGLNGVHFNMHKFTTMEKDADKKLNKLLSSNEHLNAEWERHFKLENDPRVTKTGHILRKYKIDELPQFINIIKGDMSVIGPRPLTVEEFKKYFSEDEEAIYCSVRPGLTGAWQISARQIRSFNNRIMLELHYVNNCSLFYDLKILNKTIKYFFRAKL